MNLKNTISHCKILIVDDDEKIRSLLASFFRDLGNQCEVAFDGKEGFEKAISSHYDLVIMDVQMPNMDGLESIQAIRMVDPHLPILIMTGHCSEENISKGLKDGANGFILKPFDFQSLLNHIWRIFHPNLS